MLLTEGSSLAKALVVAVNVILWEETLLFCYGFLLTILQGKCRAKQMKVCIGNKPVFLSIHHWRCPNQNKGVASTNSPGKCAGTETVDDKENSICGYWWNYVVFKTSIYVISSGPDNNMKNKHIFSRKANFY